jgi:hypothetical protein
MSSRRDSGSLATDDSVLSAWAGDRAPDSWDYAVVLDLMRRLETLTDSDAGLALRLMAALYGPANALHAHDVCDAIDIWFHQLQRPELVSHLEARLALATDSGMRRKLRQWIRSCTRSVREQS